MAFPSHYPRRLALLLFLSCCSLLTARASHIVGGQMQMAYQQEGRYELTLRLYFDAIYGSVAAIDPRVTVTIFERGTHSRKGEVVLPFIRRTGLPSRIRGCRRSTLRTDELTYRTILTLDPAQYTSVRGYYMVWERCCRNNNISNIQFPGSVGQAFYLEFPALRDAAGRPFVNSTPNRLKPIGDFACVGTPFSFQTGAGDPDGDSLVFELVSPLAGYTNPMGPTAPPTSGPYPPVPWDPDYDSLQQIAGPQVLRVSRDNGTVTFTAGFPGLYVFGIRCTEYRQGRKLGEVRYEYQQVVLNCPPNSPPSLTVAEPGPRGTTPVYTPGATMVLPASQQNRCVNLYGLDPDRNAQITFRLLASPPSPDLPTLSVSTGRINGPGLNDTLYAQLCFSPCYDSNGPRSLKIVVESSNCPDLLRDTVELIVDVKGRPDVRPSIRLTPDQHSYEVQAGDSVRFTITGTDPDVDLVTVSALNLESGPLAGQPIVSPSVSAPGLARTSLQWRIDCNTPPGLYELRLRAASAGCVSQQVADTTVQVRVLPGDTVRVLPPNVFTPDNDGLNDVFQPAAGLAPACDEEFRMVRIFNRWGRLVFSSSDRFATWTGQGVGEGMYFYLLEYSDRSYKGWVELVR